MEEITIGKIAKEIEGNDPIKPVKPTFKVEKVEGIQGKKVEDTLKKPKENLHHFLGHNFDKKV